jgi:hypothetical protein
VSTTPELSPDLPRKRLVEIFREYSDYDLVGDVGRARLFIQAARMLLATPIRRSASAGRGGEEVELEPRIVLEQMQQAEQWYHTNYAATRPLRQVVPHEDWR